MLVGRLCTKRNRRGKNLGFILHCMLVGRLCMKRTGGGKNLFFVLRCMLVGRLHTKRTRRGKKLVLLFFIIFLVSKKLVLLLFIILRCMLAGRLCMKRTQGSSHSTWWPSHRQSDRDGLRLSAKVSQSVSANIHF